MRSNNRSHSKYLKFFMVRVINDMIKKIINSYTWSNNLFIIDF